MKYPSKRTILLVFLIGAVFTSLFFVNSEVNYAYRTDARCFSLEEKNFIREGSCQKRDDLRIISSNLPSFSETAKINRTLAMRYFLAGNMQDFKKNVLFWLVDMGRASKATRAIMYLDFFEGHFLPDCQSNAESSPDLCGIYMTTAGELFYINKDIEKARKMFTKGIGLEERFDTEFMAAGLLGKQAVLELKYGESCYAERYANEAITRLSAFVGTSIGERVDITDHVSRAKKISTAAKRRCEEGGI